MLRWYKQEYGAAKHREFRLNNETESNERAKIVTNHNLSFRLPPKTLITLLI